MLLAPQDHGVGYTCPVLFHEHDRILLLCHQKEKKLSADNVKDLSEDIQVQLPSFFIFIFNED
jgi:hypothetical protein